MSYSILSLSFWLTTLAVPDRPLPIVPKGPDIEQGWYDQLQRTGALAIDLKDGRIVLSTREIKDGKLILPTIRRFDDKHQLTYTASAKEAELCFDTRARVPERLLVLFVRDWSVLFPDGTQSHRESAILVVELAPAK